jgi:hypothetical protein
LNHHEEIVYRRELIATIDLSKKAWESICSKRGKWKRYVLWGGNNFSKR